MSRELIFVDTETTGLNPEKDALVELTWAREVGPTHTLWFGVEEVPDFIDNLIKFTERGISGRQSTVDEFNAFFEASEGATMVAANPAFDKGFIDSNLPWRFHYRMLDIETFAMAKLSLVEVPSMKEVYQLLKDMGFRMTEPDHTSRNDVLAMRDAFRALNML